MVGSGKAGVDQLHPPPATLAAIADKALKEVLYHQDHAALWLNRLGLGTDESKFRMQRGLDELWPYLP